MLWLGLLIGIVLSIVPVAIYLMKECHIKY